MKFNNKFCVVNRNFVQTDIFIDSILVFCVQYFKCLDTLYMKYFFDS